ncbi:hypothetical protein M5K25_011271 [Dendrobium thyrsiflorum]|uniref:Uncharacterized protein n=1 Tax=Dendrobium thyrsiflorum TaxID=117978 RepID=A0ABD0V9F7_DENTH
MPNSFGQHFRHLSSRAKEFKLINMTSSTNLSRLISIIECKIPREILANAGMALGNAFIALQYLGNNDEGEIFEVLVGGWIGSKRDIKEWGIQDVGSSFFVVFKSGVKVLVGGWIGSKRDIKEWGIQDVGSSFFVVFKSGVKCSSFDSTESLIEPFDFTRRHLRILQSVDVVCKYSTVKNMGTIGSSTMLMLRSMSVSTVSGQRRRCRHAH